MAPAMLAPAMMAKAEGIAAAVMREMRQEICVLHFNDDLDIVGPGTKYAFKLTITPALFATIGAIGVAIYAIMKAGGMFAVNKSVTGNESADDILEKVSPLVWLYRRS